MVSFLPRSRKPFNEQQIDTTTNEPKSKYTSQHINDVKELAISLSKQILNDNQTEMKKKKELIVKLLAIMQRYSDSIIIQQTVCHILSRIANNKEKSLSKHIIRKNGFHYILNALTRFMFNDKLCKMGCSAIWNLSRLGKNREKIAKSSPECIQILFQILNKYKYQNSNVTFTAVGAVMNLSLCRKLKHYIAIRNSNHIKWILEIIKFYSEGEENKINIVSLCIGIFANLSSCNDCLIVLLMDGTVMKVILNMIQSDRYEKIYRNCCCALNNMAKSEDFMDRMLELKGVETIYNFISKYYDKKECIQMLRRSLKEMECKFHKTTTTFHLCCRFGKIEILQELIENSPVSVDIIKELNKTDGHGKTCLDYATAMLHEDVITFLSDIQTQNKYGKRISPSSEGNETVPISCRVAMHVKSDSEMNITYM